MVSSARTKSSVNFANARASAGGMWAFASVRAGLPLSVSRRAVVIYATMKKITMTQAFAAYNAPIRNPGWAFSAIAQDGSLVFSCWEFLFYKLPGRPLRYEDDLSRWANQRSINRAREDLQLAFENDRDVRVVVANTKDAKVKANLTNARGKSTFSVRPDLVGKVTTFNGNWFIIDFHQGF